MKKFLTIVLLVLVSTFTLESHNVIFRPFEIRHIKEVTVVHKRTLKQITGNKDLVKFLEQMAIRESGKDTLSVNKYGYLGKYQFGKAALKETGYEHVNKDKFKNNPKIFNEADQDKAMLRLLKLNNRRLYKLFKKYKGKTINGIKVTKSGMLAASHLAGVGNVMKFLESNGNINKHDAFGTSVSDYMQQFSGYNINLTNVNV